MMMSPKCYSSPMEGDKPKSLKMDEFVMIFPKIPLAP
jgi:hypothetical protein